MNAYVVFVHGVANREGVEYGKTIAKRTERFRKLVFGEQATIENPYWGEFGANPEGGLYKSLPSYDDPTAGGVEVLAIAPRIAEGPALRLIDLARENFPETVDLIFEGVLEQAQEGDAHLPDDAVERAQVSAAYALAVPNPPWLQAELTDEQFLKELTRRTAVYAQAHSAGASEREVEVLGLGSWLRDSAENVINRVRNAGGRVALAVGRESVHEHVATFIGDIFSYLKDGSGRTPIRALMRETLTKAVDSGDPIVLIGHSMGGVILADCLGDKAFCDSVGLKDGQRIKALVTVGSQPGFFQELNLLGLQPNPTLNVVDSWINVFDELDVLSFRAAPLFDGEVRDMMFSSRTGIFDAHSAYFSRIQFYERLRKRLKEVGVPVKEAA